MTLKNNPCHKCTTETGRHIGCHSTCEKYIKANNEHNKLKEEIRKKADSDRDALEYRMQSIERAKRNGGYKSNIFRQTKK